MMVWTVVLIQFQRLLHNRVELLLTFVVPIAFFSIFALIFGGGVGSGMTPKIKVVAVDEVSSDASAQVLQQLKASPGLRFIHGSGDDNVDEPLLGRIEAEKFVRRGNATMAIVIRRQNSATSQTNAAETDALSPPLHADLVSDSSDQVATQVVTALVSRAIMISAAQQQQNEFAVFGNLPGEADLEFSEVNEYSSEADSGRQLETDAWLERGATGGSGSAASGPTAAAGPDPSSPIEPDSSSQPAGQSSLNNPVTVIDILGENKTNPVVSMYAAGIAVMFLLFGASGGGGALLEEKENRTLDRLLSTQMSMDHLLLGKWFYITATGITQVTVMFIWAQLVFDVDLIGHLDGFLTITIVTAAAAAAFGLLLATLCKTRGQLNGLSVILILTMSALGGSMVPRYVMSDQLQAIGLWTFNAWALDGYRKIFWRELPIASLAPQLSVLMSSTLVFLLAARWLAIRWEAD